MRVFPFEHEVKPCWVLTHRSLPSNSRLFCGTPDAARCGPRRALTDDMLPGWRHSQVGLQRRYPRSGRQGRWENFRWRSLS